MTTPTSIRDRVQPSADFISFRTRSTISVNDLRRLTFGLEASYGVFLAFDFLNAVVDDPTDPRRGLINYYDVRLLSYLTEGWKYELTATRQDYSRFFREKTFDIEFEREAVVFLEFLRDAAYRWVPESELRVRTIVLRSPGYISFEGAGDVIKQLRYLIKDIHYRNRQEKEAGDIKLDAARRALEALPAANQLRGPGMADKANLLLTAGMEELFDLEKEGKLEQLDLFLDKDEDQS